MGDSVEATLRIDEKGFKNGIRISGVVVLRKISVLR